MKPEGIWSTRLIFKGIELHQIKRSSAFMRFSNDWEQCSGKMKMANILEGNYIKQSKKDFKED